MDESQTRNPAAHAATLADTDGGGAGVAAMAARAATAPARSTPRDAKFRQAAFAYLHVGLLYEATAIVFWRQGLFPEGRGPAWLWLAIGVVIIAIVVRGLWSWRNAWFARAVFAVHALRLPTMIEGSFFPDPTSPLPPAFFLTALGVVVVNLWMLARAGWDL